MRWSTRTLILVGLGVTTGSVGVLGVYEYATITPPAGHYATEPTQQRELQDLAAEVTRWQANTRQFAQLASEIKSELATLRLHLAQVDRDQVTTGQRINQITAQLNQTGRMPSLGPASDDQGDMLSLTPEEALAREAARTQAELELLESTLLSQTFDHEWATAAQHALQTRFQQEALPGAQLVEADCRSTLCRLELSLDNATPADSLRKLTDLVPWSGQSLMQIDTETGVAVMYLARDEYPLP